MKDKPTIIWNILMVTNDTRSFLPQVDPCYQIAKAMINEMQEYFNFIVIVPYDCQINMNNEFPEGTRFIMHEPPVHHAYMRFHFDFKFYTRYAYLLKRASLMISDDNTHVANWRALYHSFGQDIKIVSLTPYVDYPTSRKVDEEISYHARQMESFEKSDLVAFQSQFNKEEAAEYHFGKSTIWPWGYSQKEVDKYRTQERFERPTILFSNRITEAADRYTNWHIFAAAIARVKHEADFIFRNPTRKITKDQHDEILSLSEGRAYIVPNSAPHSSREDYMKNLNLSHISIHLFDKAHRGMSHDEAAAMGKITIAPNILSNKEFWDAGDYEYPFLLNEIEPKELARVIDEAIDHKDDLNLQNMNISAAQPYSYEHVSRKAIRDVHQLLSMPIQF